MCSKCLQYPATPSFVEVTALYIAWKALLVVHRMKRRRQRLNEYSVAHGSYTMRFQQEVTNGLKTWNGRTSSYHTQFTSSTPRSKPGVFWMQNRILVKWFPNHESAKKKHTSMISLPDHGSRMLPVLKIYCFECSVLVVEDVTVVCRIKRNRTRFYRGGALLNKLKTCTREDPTTTTKKKMINVLLTGKSSSRSAAFPTETFPRLETFLSNWLLRLRIFLGRGYKTKSKAKVRMLVIDNKTDEHSN